MERIFFYCAINYLTGPQGAQIREDTGPKRSPSRWFLFLQIDFATKAGSSLSIRTSAGIAGAHCAKTSVRRFPSRKPRFRRQKKKASPTISVPLYQRAGKANEQRLVAIAPKQRKPFHFHAEKMGGPPKQKTRRRKKKSATRQSIRGVAIAPQKRLIEGGALLLG